MTVQGCCVTHRVDHPTRVRHSVQGNIMKLKASGMTSRDFEIAATRVVGKESGWARLFADKLGVHHTTVYRWIDGAEIPRWVMFRLDDFEETERLKRRVVRLEGKVNDLQDQVRRRRRSRSR